MKWFHWAGNNKGSVTILAIGIMAFLGLILSGVLPMITQEIRIGTMNRDVVEAQYAAESGLKRTIAGMEAGSASWTWIGQARQFTSEAGKTYTVTVQATSPNTLTNGAAPASGWYHLQSVGRVGNATRTVSVRVNITGGGLSGVFTNGVFGASRLSMDSNGKIDGSAGTNGNITMENGSEITGNATAVGTIYVNPWSNAKISGTQTSNSASIAVPTFSVAFTTPAKPTAPTVVASTAWPLGTWSVNNTASPLASGYYTASGGLSSGASKIATQNNTTLYVNGGFSMDNSIWTMGSNAVIDVLGGGMSLTSSSTLQTQATSTLYIRDGLNLDKTLNMGANSTIYAGQGVQTNSNATLTLPGVSTFYMANGSLTAGNGSVINFGSVGSKSLLYCNGSANISGTTINIAGPAIGSSFTEVYFTGDLDLNGGTTLNIAGNVIVYITGQLKMSAASKIQIADNTNVVFKIAGAVDLNGRSKVTTGTTNSALVFLVDDKFALTNYSEIDKALVVVTGNVELNSNSKLKGSIISTGGEAYLTNRAEVTYNPDVVLAVLTNNPGLITGGGGTGSGGTTVTPSDWKN